MRGRRSAKGGNGQRVERVQRVEQYRSRIKDGTLGVPRVGASAAVEGEAASCRFAGVAEPWPREAAGSCW